MPQVERRFITDLHACCFTGAPIAMRQFLAYTFVLVVLCLGCDTAGVQQQAKQARASETKNELREPRKAMPNAPSNQADETIVCVPQYVSLREYEFKASKPTEGMVRCVFQNISFEIPTKLAARPRIFRSSTSSIWLVFEERGRFMQIPLSSPDLASMISDPPPELVNTTIPGMLATMAVVATGDSSSESTLSERHAYEWAIANRGAIGLAKPMDRFAVRSSDTLHAILISADPNAKLAEKQIRSWLVWQEAESGESGSMWVSDSNADRTEWINDFATSIEFIPNAEATDLTADDYAKMGDNEILSMLTTRRLDRP